MQRGGTLTSRPSTADRAELAGVIMLPPSIQRGTEQAPRKQGPCAPRIRVEYLLR